MQTNNVSVAEKVKSYGIGALGLGVLGLSGYYIGEKSGATKVSPVVPATAVPVEKATPLLAEYFYKQRELLSREVVLEDEIRNQKGDVISRSFLFRTYEHGATPFTICILRSISPLNVLGASSAYWSIW